MAFSAFFSLTLVGASNPRKISLEFAAGMLCFSHVGSCHEANVRAVDEDHYVDYHYY
jgi:hypothetical protein